MSNRRSCGAGCLLYCVIAFLSAIGSMIGLLSVASRITGAGEITERVILSEEAFVLGIVALFGLITGLTSLFLRYLLLRNPS